MKCIILIVKIFFFSRENLPTNYTSFQGPHSSLRYVENCPLDHAVVYLLRSIILNLAFFSNKTLPFQFASWVQFLPSDLDAHHHRKRAHHHSVQPAKKYKI